MFCLQRHLLYKQRYINAIMDANSVFEGKQIDFMQKQKQYVNTRVEKKKVHFELRRVSCGCRKVERIFLNRWQRC